MEMKLDQENRQLKIEDNFKFTIWMVKFVMIANVVQTLMRIFNASISEWDTLTWLWIPIGIFSLFMLFYFSKLSTAEVIPLEDIQHSVYKNFFGRKRLSLKLKNGKTRYLPTKSINQIQEVQNFLNSKQTV